MPTARIAKLAVPQRGEVGSQAPEQPIDSDELRPRGLHTVLGWELRAAIIDELGLGIDEVWLRLAMQRVLEPCSAYVGARRTGMAFGRIRRASRPTSACGSTPPGECATKRACTDEPDQSLTNQTSPTSWWFSIRIPFFFATW